MSDFSLMDAIECGIVKLPRVPVADNIPGDEMPMFRNLWETHPHEHAQERAAARRRRSIRSNCPRSCRRPWKRSTATTRRPSSSGQKAGISVPPCFIIVCNNTATSKLVYDYISGFHRENEDGIDDARERPPRALPQLRRAPATRSPRPNTLLIDSEQLESGDALDDNFRAMAADEIERFRREIIERTGDQPSRPRTSPTRNCSAKS